ncbi:MAG: recombinase family protein [Bacteroidales bacterium]|nr:recombinase family protein [Bacteroidales bacterium]MDY6423942.1 recombinase family protein [Bacteroidales bacterium]
MFTGRVVREIPAIYNPRKVLINEIKGQRVAAYCRVSTNNKEQEESFENQVEHFEKVIGRHEGWQLAKIYADPGITGTKTESRKEFLQMISDCENGKIDRVMVKSISRFARNTVDTLNNIRKLKELGISVYFENENIDTMTTGGEVLLTILAAIAEQESRNISTNIKWAYRKRFKEGRVLINYRQVLGWDKEEFINEEGLKDSRYVIVESEAETVRKIYRDYLDGKTPTQIANDLNEKGITTKRGNKWNTSCIQAVLTNEKYTGNALLGKSYKPDVLSKQRLKNEGQEAQFYVENSHPAIISQEMFDMVQAEKQRRLELRSGEKTGTGKYSSTYSLSGLLVCGNCGTKFRRYGRSLKNGENITTWVCQRHQHHHDDCDMKPLREIDVVDAYKRVIKTHGGDLQEILDILKENINEEIGLTEKDEEFDLDAEILKKQQRILELYRLKATNQIGQEQYEEEFQHLSKDVITLQESKSEIEKKNLQNRLAISNLRAISEQLTNGEMDITDIGNMKNLLNCIRVINKHEIEFQFKCGLNIKEAV